MCEWEFRGEAPGRVRKGRIPSVEKDTTWFSKMNRIWPEKNSQMLSKWRKMGGDVEGLDPTDG